jgi:hypothetical protein
MTKEIQLTQGMVALVDDDDYEWLNQYNWHCARKTYAGRREANKPNGEKGKIVLMHRVIMNPPKDMVVDHINGDTLDNRRSNLRICTKRDNQRNHKRLSTNKSGYTGVHYRKDTEKWVATIGDLDSGTYHRIGEFLDPVKAAKAYDKKALELFGEFARLNFPNEDVSGLDLTPDKKPLYSSNKTGYRGVCWSKEHGKYVAQLNRLGKLGHFDNPVEAARAFDKAAREVYGEKAQLNFPDEPAE